MKKLKRFLTWLLIDEATIREMVDREIERRGKEAIFKPLLKIINE